jgi:thioesterase domain-containing protein
MLQLRDQSPELIKPYQSTQDPNLENLIFIHPGFGGSEVYQYLSELLAGRYNCWGINNYNIYNKSKITSLNAIARHYLSLLRQCNLLNEPLNLIGLSMGGLIAMEIASILESENYTDINITLLDTYIHDEQMHGFFSEADHLNFRDSERSALLLKYDPAYVEKVMGANIAEMEIARSVVGSKLEHSTVTLFKAGQGMVLENIEDAGRKNSYYISLRANNIDQVAANVQTFTLDCNHDNILETKSAEISRCILSLIAVTSD